MSQETVADLIAEELKETSDPDQNLEGLPRPNLGAADERLAEPEEEAGDTEEASETETDQADDDVVTIASLAAELEIEPERLYGMKVGIDGHDPMTISELKDMAFGNLEHKKQIEGTERELAERIADLDAREREIQAQAQNIAPPELIKAHAELESVQREIAQYDWPRIEAENPGQAALLKQKLWERKGIAEYNIKEIEAKREQTLGEIEANRHKAQQAQMQHAIERLHGMIPEWREPAVQQRETEKLVSFLVSRGFDENRVRGEGDPAVVKGWRDLWQWESKAETVKEKSEPPKVLKPDVVREKGLGKKKADERFFENARKSKDSRVKNDATAKLLREAGIA